MKMFCNRKGTILIWTVLLGIMLTSVFFFLAMRLSGVGAEQRETIQYQNQKAYLDSYVAYLMNDPSSLSELNTTIDGIKVVLTQQVDEITYVIDSGAEETYEFSGNIDISWNECGEFADILVDNTKYLHAGPCADGYEDTTTINVPNPFTIKSLNAPFHYRITSGNPVDNKWHLEASINLGYGKKIEVEKVF